MVRQAMVDQAERVEFPFPEITFWNKEAPQITFINPNDFRRKTLLEILGLDRSPLAESFGVADREEVTRRQRIAKFLFENPSLIKFFLRTDFSFSIPMDGQSFLNYYNPKRRHNPFWRAMERFSKIVLSCQDVPPEISSLTTFLSQTSIETEKIETEMAKEIGERLQKATYFEGVACFEICSNGGLNFREDDTVFFGFKKYSYTLARVLREVRSSLDNSFFDTIVKGLQAITSWINGRIFYKPLRIRQLPLSAIRDIENFLKTKAKDCLADLYEGDQRTVTLKILFRFSDKGLTAQLVGIESKEESDQDTTDGLNSDFSGYSIKDRHRIRKTNRLILGQVARSEEQLFLAVALAKIKKSMPEIIEGMVPIESPSTELEYKWDMVSVLCGHEFKKVYRVIEQYHDYFGSHFQILREIAQDIQTLNIQAKKWHKPLCFPTILEDGNHLVSFESLEPIHLVSQIEKVSERSKKLTQLVPINSLPKLNGQMIGLTGQNAGGKSTTMETIINMIYLAQSGLPVFGNNVSLNVKSRIGMCFLERGSGSTLQLLLEKAKAILEVLDGKDQSETLLVVDEVGTGTQEVDGLDFGKVFLGKLSGSGCSIIFSTQITELAKYAQENLDAQCFTFDLKHHISSGIGKGGIEKLVKQMGIKELLR